jgi:N-formylglutamate amidohydrolase
MKLADTNVTPYSLALPLHEPIPLVCDSPHSGADYPADFHVNLPFALLQTAEDAWVHELWHDIPQAGGTLLRANFPRTYIDLNRELDDIDPAVLAEPWPGELRPSSKSRAGCGLIWTLVRGHALYDHKLWVASVQQRIDQYYLPYYQALERRMAQLQERFGVVWHLNVHSMPSDTLVQMAGNSQPLPTRAGTSANVVTGTQADAIKGTPADIVTGTQTNVVTGALADVVLGDIDGTSCDPTYIGIVEDFFLARGYTVARNHPFKGAALLARFGQPARHRHSLQIELNRALYMNEKTGQKSARFVRLQNDLSDLTTALAGFVRGLL